MNDKNEFNNIEKLLESGQNPLNNIDTVELLKKIEEFKKMDLKNATYNEVSEKSLRTLTAMNVSSSLIKENTHLYRVRKLRDDLSNIPTTYQDIWYPKVEYVKTDGRANRAGNPMLYCSMDQVTPIHECGIQEKDWYAIVQYHIKPGHKLQAYVVGNDSLPQGLDKNGEINHRIISDFVTSEFCKPVGKGTEYLYKISNVICSNFLDMPFCDGYLYPSIAYYKKGYNVAIKPASADANLDFDCVLICQRGKIDLNKGYEFFLKHKANSVDSNGRLKYNF